MNVERAYPCSHLYIQATQQASDKLIPKVFEAYLIKERTEVTCTPRRRYRGHIGFPELECLHDTQTRLHPGSGNLNPNANVKIRLDQPDAETLRQILKHPLLQHGTQKGSTMLLITSNLVRASVREGGGPSTYEPIILTQSTLGFFSARVLSSASRQSNIRGLPGIVLQTSCNPSV